MIKVTLQRAELEKLGACSQGLSGANLRGANLYEANLSGANLSGATGYVPQASAP
jgi:uncharacterized protein YjbI with pentapeptide repeats